MARVTVEDCVDKVSNRFDLVLLSAHRAREISGGSELTIDRDRDKNPVVALREIAEQTVRPHDIQDALVGSMQKVVVDDDDTPDEISSISRSAEALRLTARSEEHTSELQSLMRISYAVFCLKKKKIQNTRESTNQEQIHDKEIRSTN